MSFLDKFPKNPSPDEVMRELQRYLGTSVTDPGTSGPSSSKGVKGKIKSQPVVAPVQLSMEEMVHSGVWLIRHLPVARDAVFDFISVTYDEFIKTYLSQTEGSGLSALPDNHLKILDDIHAAFNLYLDASGEIWAPILSQWTLHLLGQLSQEYSGRPAFASAQNVNEIIHIWMGSKAIQSLLELTSRCLTCSDHANADSFISALLDTSAIHSPHFDWVVAHVGNSYPQTVVSQVLNLGLQNFSTNPPMVSKLTSVVGILGHLVTTHSKEVQHAFEQTLQNGLSDNNKVAEKYSIPYLLQMCSNSRPLLDVLLDSILPKINEDTLHKLRVLVPKWIKLHFGGHQMAIVALVTHLILKSLRGPKALELLMNECKSWPPPISQHARTLLDHFTAEVSTMAYNSESTKKDLATTFPCISAMKDNAEVIVGFLTDSDSQICRTAKQFVKLLALYDGPAIAVKAVCHYLRESLDDKHLWHLIDLVGMLEMKFSTILEDSLQIVCLKSDQSHSNISQRMKKDASYCLRRWKNILKIIKTETQRGEKLPIKYKLCTVIRENLGAFIPLLDIREMGFSLTEASIILEILAKIPEVTQKSKFGTLLALSRHLVELLFRALSVSQKDGEENNHTEKVKNVSNISKLLNELAEHQAIQNDSLRSLIQYMLYPESKKLFMSRVIGNPKLNYSVFDFDLMENESDEDDDNEFQPEKFSMYVSLMKENQTRSATLNVAGAHATTFHSGKLLKNGVKNWSALPKVVIHENADADVNFELFLSVILSVCTARCGNPVGVGGEWVEGETVELSMNPKEKGQHVSVEAMKRLALLLVEIVSPDVMFNGLPWPDEDCARHVQVERDLQIRRAFEEHPYLWDILELVARHCPSLCYCSVLLRALMSTLMAHWTCCQESSGRSYPMQLEWTIRLLTIMKLGEILPPPLCYVGKVVHELKSSEIVGLLRDIWAFMRKNVPDPTLFIRDSPAKKFTRNPDYCKVDPELTETLRLTILNNVEKLGYLYCKLFPVVNPPVKNGKDTTNGNR